MVETFEESKCLSDPAEALRQERLRKQREKQQEFLKMQQKRKTEEDIKVLFYAIKNNVIIITPLLQSRFSREI